MTHADDPISDLDFSDPCHKENTFPPKSRVNGWADTHMLYWVPEDVAEISETLTPGWCQSATKQMGSTVRDISSALSDPTGTFSLNLGSDIL